ncbi:MAG: lipopolysaccharide kinase InaA family protein [Gemmataceae bacterium]
MIVWHPAPGWPAGLTLDPSAWPLEPVKLAPHRDVHRARVGGHDLHLKHYRPDGRERLRAWVRATKGQAEFERGRELLRRGVPTLEPLAWGAAGLHSYVVTRTLSDAVTLLDWLQGRWDDRLPGLLGRFLARCHEAGVRHDDLHPGNVLVTPDLSLYLIDLHMARLGPPLTAAESRANLVVLDRWFALRYSRPQRLRAWRAYEAARPGLGLDAGELAEATRRSLLTFVRELDGRCRGKGRHFRRVPGGLAAATLDAAVLRALAAQADERLDDTAAPVMKRSASSTVMELDVLHGGAARPMVLKRFDATRWSDPLAAWFRPGPALRSWRLGHALAVRGLPTPRCHAVWHAGATGYLLQEKVPEARYLKEYLTGAGRPGRWDIARQVGRLLRRLHGWDISHRDLKAPNLLVSPARAVMGVRGLEAPAADGGAHLWLVDLVGARVCRHLSERRRMRDLARLNASFFGDPAVSRTDRLRALGGYLNEALAGRGAWKRWWRGIAALSEAKRRRNESVGRVLG